MGVNTKLAETNILLLEIRGILSTMLVHDDAWKLDWDEYHEAFLTLSGFLNVAIGTFNEAESGTILYTLRTIQQCICLLAGGAPPDGPSPNGCDTPLQSIPSPLLASEDYPGRSFITWDAVLPQGIVLDSFLIPPLPEGIELHFTGSTIYNIYVQSSCSTFSQSPADLTTWPTNTWTEIVGPAHVALSVEEGCSAIAYICIDPDTGFVDCVQRGSLAGDALYIDASGEEFPGTPAYIPLDALGAGECVNDISWGSPPRSFHSTDGCHILAVDCYGWTFQRIGGSAMQISWIPLDLATDQHHTWSTSDTSTYTMPDHTAYLLIDNAVGGPGDGTTPFVCRICPAEEA